mmetsp:Transcript_37740/g.43104  ORF Transcript_37740/g.43104 Transcript_37740/m.43104 type:complete len:92 (+) Transcript_37740:90-365(+)
MKTALFALFSFIASSAVMGNSSTERDMFNEIGKELDQLQDLVDQVNTLELPPLEQNRRGDGYDSSSCYKDSDCRSNNCVHKGYSIFKWCRL